MTVKSVLMRPQGLRSRARDPTCSPFATPLWPWWTCTAYFSAARKSIKSSVFASEKSCIVSVNCQLLQDWQLHCLSWFKFATKG